MVKTCTSCGSSKELTEFNFKRKEEGSRASVCKACHKLYRRKHYLKNQDYYQRKARKWGKANLDKVEDQRLKKFGINSATYQQLLLTQKNVCAICGQPDRCKRLAVDHCHKTGKVRGLLCSACNMSIGLLGENLGRIQAAIAYLQKSK